MTDAPQSATHDGSAMKLVCHPTGHAAPEIRPAPLERDWMNATPDRFAYRCLPLNIANAHGWELLCPAAFSAIWDGGPHPGAVRIIDGAEANQQGTAELHANPGAAPVRLTVAPTTPVRIGSSSRSFTAFQAS